MTCRHFHVSDLCFEQGVGGSVQYPKNYLKEAYNLVRERGGVCIADEVRCTFYTFNVTDYSLKYIDLYNYTCA